MWYMWCILTIVNCILTFVYMCIYIDIVIFWVSVDWLKYKYGKNSIVVYTIVYSIYITCIIIHIVYIW